MHKLYYILLGASLLFGAEVKATQVSVYNCHNEQEDDWAIVTIHEENGIYSGTYTDDEVIDHPLHVISIGDGKYHFSAWSGEKCVYNAQERTISECTHGYQCVPNPS